MSYKVLSRVLDIPEGIAKFFIDVFELIEIRGHVDSCKNIQFDVRTKENGINRPHIHALYDKYDISITIDDKIEIIESKWNMPKRNQNIALKHVKDNIEMYRNEWNNIHFERKIDFVKSYINHGE